MQYKPYTEAQIQSMKVIDEGIYPFRVIEVFTQDKYGYQMKDRNGVEMAKLKLMIWDNKNIARTIYTFVSGDGNFAYKLRHFAKSIGMISEYESGKFDIETIEGARGKANIIIKKGTIKADGSGEMWPDRNDVKDFVIDDPSQELKTTKKVSQPVNQSIELDDDIPF